MKYLNSKKLRRKFAAAAGTYDEAAVLQREVADRMLERLAFFKMAPGVILDIGCGTGYCTSVLQKLYPDAYVMGFDVAYPMLKQAEAVKHTAGGNSGFFSADAHLIPVKSNQVDLVISNLVLQWCDPKSVFSEIERVLKPGGLVMFTTFGPDTLSELREAWSRVDDHQHVHDFIDMHNLGDDLLQSGLAEPVMDKEIITMTYKDVMGMIKDLRGIGANNAVKAQFTGLTGKDRFARFEQSYKSIAKETEFQGRIPASYEIIYGHAWGSNRPVENQASQKKIIPIKPLNKPGQ